MFKYGLNGIILAFAKSKLLLLCTFFTITLIMCYVFGATPFEYVVILICSSMLMALEMLNTSIEILCDLVDPNTNPQIMMIKDISAGAILLFTISDFIIGCIIFVPKLLMYL